MRGPNHYGDLKTAHATADLEQTPHQPEQTAEREQELRQPNNSLNDLDQQRAALEKDLNERLEAGRIDRHEVRYQLDRFDNNPPQVLAELQPSHRDDRTNVTYPASGEREAEAAQHEFAKGGEMTDSKQARFDRLMDQINDEIELDQTHDHDGPQRGGRGFGE